MNKKEIADKFYEIVELMEILDKNQYKIRAYRNAARNISSTDWDIRELYEKGNLKEIPGVGDSTASKIEQIIESGTCEYLENLKEEIPDGLKEVKKVQGIGKKAVKKLYDELGVESLDDLEEVAQSGTIRNLSGFGKKTEQNILEGIEYLRKFSDRYRLDDAWNNAHSLASFLSEKTNKLEIVGSLRRRKETVGDIDILTTGDSDTIMEATKNYEDVMKVLVSGDTKTSVMLDNGLQIDVRVIEPECWGAAIQYFTGSKEHNIKVRKRAQQYGWTLNEYRMADMETDEKIAGEKEREIYEKLGFEYIPPELRDDRGEHEAALNNNLPDLVKESDIMGDIHIHSDYSDGNVDIPGIVSKAIELDYEYVGIADHQRPLGDMDENDIINRNMLIDDLNDKHDIKILKGVEVDIMKDGDIYKEDWLDYYDYVIGAVHQSITDENIVERLHNAFSTNSIDVLAHPTGRVIGEREGNEVLQPKHINTFHEDYGIIFEINSLPQRLDLNDEMIMDTDVMYEIGSDAHGTTMMDFVRRFGVGIARRGWLEPSDIINTRPVVY